MSRKTSSLQTALEIDLVGIKNAFSLYKAICHPLRLQIIKIIHNSRKIKAAQLIKRIDIEQSVVSQPLKILRDSKFLKGERKGKFLIYSLNYEQINNLMFLSEKLAPLSSSDRELLQTLVSKSKFKLNEFGVAGLTEREITIVKLICDQKTSIEISEQLKLSKRTVNGHREDILKKMQVKNTAGIVIYAIKNKLYKI